MGVDSIRSRSWPEAAGLRDTTRIGRITTYWEPLRNLMALRKKSPIAVAVLRIVHRQNLRGVGLVGYKHL
jgi:hypothetical protein